MVNPAAEVGAEVVAAAAPQEASDDFHFVLATVGLLPVGLLDAVIGVFGVSHRVAL